MKILEYAANAVGDTAGSPGPVPEQADSERRNGERLTFAPNIAVAPTIIAPGVRDINAIAARFQ